MNTPDPTHYEMLGIEKDASPAQIKTAWRKVLHFAHPDKGAPAGLFRSLEMSYLILADEHQRAMYDRSLAVSSSETSGPTPEPAQQAPTPGPGSPRPSRETAEPKISPDPPEDRADGPVRPRSEPGPHRVRFRPGFHHGLPLLIIALLADAGITFGAAVPMAAVGALALAGAVNLRFQDARTKATAIALCVAAAGYPFGDRWQQLIAKTPLLTITHLGMMALVHAALVITAARAGYVYGRTLLFNRFIPKKALKGARVFGTRGGGRHWQDAHAAKETARTVELAAAEIPGSTVLHGLRILNGDDAIFIDHAIMVGRRVVLIISAQLDAGQYTQDTSGSYLQDGHYFPNNYDEIAVGSAAVRKAAPRGATVNDVVVVIAGTGVHLNAPGMVIEPELAAWLAAHFDGVHPVVDRLMIKMMSAYVLA